MDKLVYLYYPLLAVVLLWGVKFYKKGTWNDGFMSLSQTKALQGFFALLIMFHHAGQKTCAPWLNPKFIIPGLELFVPIGYFFVGIFLFCSGYGLFKSYKAKPDYLNGFFKRRILPLIVAFYTTGWIFLIVRFLMKQKMDTEQIIYYITGLQLSNPNAWYVITLPFFYLAFYLFFKFIKKDGWAIFATCFVVFAYTVLGTCIDHNDFWMRGEWWYNSVHFFSLGLLFAKFEEPVIKHVKKYYILYLILAFVGIFVFYGFSEYTQATFSYYGENMRLPFGKKVGNRWICLISQMLASCAFVFFVFMLGMKMKIGNKVLNFMGTITLEFYLIHGLFVELFGFNFVDARPAIHYIKNVALYVLVVLVLGLISAILLQKLHNLILGKYKKPADKSKTE